MNVNQRGTMQDLPPKPEGLTPDRVRPGRLLSVVNQTRGSLLVKELFCALTPWSRARGLLARAPLKPGQGLLLRPCRGVHTFFMKYTIDVIFLDRRGQVVALRPELRPWRVTPIFGEAYCTLELEAGRAAAARTEKGDLLWFEDARR